MKKVILKAEKLGKEFVYGNRTHEIFKDLNVEIYERDFTIIMGPSGAGKSTLMYTLSGMDKATRGKISFHDVELTSLSEDKLAVFRRKNCGFVFQQVYLIDKMSLMENVLATGLLVYKNKKNLIEKTKELCIKLQTSLFTRKERFLILTVPINLSNHLFLKIG